MMFLKGAARFEHRFWLQILGDHSRFIFESLAPVQKTEILEQAANFIQCIWCTPRTCEFRSIGAISRPSWNRVVQKLREFKLEVNPKNILSGKIKIHLSPTFINHMVSELEEYVRILNYLKAKQVPPVYHEVHHHHRVWLLDAAGHSEGISTNLDGVETKLKEKSNFFKKNFQDFYLKAVEMAGYLRTNLSTFPALNKFNADATVRNKIISRFFTRNWGTKGLSKAALGTFAPLMADHMYREECYYLMKLAESQNILNRQTVILQNLDYRFLKIKIGKRWNRFKRKIFVDS